MNESSVSDFTAIARQDSRNPLQLLSSQASAASATNSQAMDIRAELKSYFSTTNISFPLDGIDSLIGKAVDLSSDQFAIVRNPTPDETYQVKSKSNPHGPHLVKKNGANIVCDSSCEGFMAFKLCAHTLGVALKTGVAPEFIFRKRPSKPNLLRLATTGLSRGRGRKVTKSTNKRKFGPRNKAPKPILETVDRSFFESSFEGQHMQPERKKTSRKQAMTCRPPDCYMNDIRKMLKTSEQPVVSVGSYLIKPPQPEPQPQPYELILRQGNISVCHGCEEPFDKENNLYILGRTEYDWYPKIANATKSYKISGARNHYYCLKKRCLLLRRPLVFDIKIVHGGVTSVPDDIHAQIKDEFDTKVVLDWLY